MRPPCCTPDALSTKVVTVLQPIIAPAVVPIASTAKAFFIQGNLPFLSNIFAWVATPMRVPMVSNISTKSSMNTVMTMSFVSTCAKSNLKSMGVIEGGVSNTPLNCVIPNGLG